MTNELMTMVYDDVISHASVAVLSYNHGLQTNSRRVQCSKSHLVPHLGMAQ